MIRRNWRVARSTAVGLVMVMIAVIGAVPALALTRVESSAPVAARHTGSASLLNAVPRFTTSHSGQVRRLYLAYFRREPDRLGLEHWVRARASGVPLHQVSAEFARSREFTNTYGSLDNSKFLELVYRNVLDRAPDQGGHRYWLDQLGRGMSRGLLMLQFSESAEFVRKTGGDAAAPAVAGSGQATIASNFDVANYLMRAWGPPEDGYPAFRLFCQFSHLAYADPILDPGNDRFMHLHMFFGNTGADHRSTYESLRTTGGGTCDGGPINRTSYWMPAVFDEQHRVVVPDSFLLYYKGEIASVWAQGGLSGIVPYPNGLRLVAGATISGGADWGWKCEGGPESVRGTIPNCADGQTLIGWVRFPYCWDGQRLWAPNNEHVVFGRNLWQGCPSSHPVHLPELTQFAYFNNTRGDTSRWYLSSDRMNPSSPRPNGSTLHADWFNAWDRTVMERWIDSCLRANKTTSNGNLCDGQQLRQAERYSGPRHLAGWTPMPH
jgi:hypothetical protein